MLPLQVVTCLVLVAVATEGALVPPKAGLSFKDKLALDLPIKEQPATQKTESKAEVAKVVFPSTTPKPTTTTTTPEPEKSTERPHYIDATIFRHQFTTPAGFVAALEPLNDYEVSPFDFEGPEYEDSPPSHDYEGHFRLWEDLSPFTGEVGVSGRDLRAERYIGGYRPLGF